VALVWRALTNSDDLQRWYFKIGGFKAEPGFEFTFSGGKDATQPYTHRCEIKEVIPEKKISYSWRYEGHPGNSLVTFDLQAMGEKTKLTVTHSGLDSFPPTNSDFDENNFLEGWIYITGISLKKFIERP
jgi:uncharacterized protein YndB with AHSA1/START domain